MTTDKNSPEREALDLAWKAYEQTWVEIHHAIATLDLAKEASKQARKTLRQARKVYEQSLLAGRVKKVDNGNSQNR